jgi:hypothetical protein
MEKVMTNCYRYASLSFILLLAALVIMQPGSVLAMTVQGVTFAESFAGFVDHLAIIFLLVD